MIHHAVVLTAISMVLAAVAMLATLPVLAGLYQYLMVGLSLLRTHLERASAHYPRVAIVIPAWNEDMVIGVTIDRLMKLRYPKDRIRVYVIDDASSDDTPHITIAKMKEFPGRVVHIRRVAGGEGKAHTLNYGLDVLWRDEWTQAVLIMDADVIYTPDSLSRMCRHLRNPKIGAVTAYIKEGSAEPNLVQRFIGFEYITATGASRRAQNVMGFLACLSGGAQLHSRENMMAIGGQIFSHTLAEDTFTTFRTQMAGRLAIFEPNALVYAEEPCDLVGLWKQRIRWARGNVQITRVFRKLWFNRRAHEQMGSFSMGLLWFSIFLMPVFQISAAVALILLYFIDEPLSWALFRGFWIVAAITYLIVTFISYVVDTESAARTWFEGIIFPGIISLVLNVWALAPGLFEPAIAFVNLPDDSLIGHFLKLFLYAWLALGMVVSWSAKVLEDKGPDWAKRFAPRVLNIGGYGAFLCAVTFGAYVAEYKGAELKWDKTVKTGKVA